MNSTFSHRDTLQMGKNNRMHRAHRKQFLKTFSIPTLQLKENESKNETGQDLLAEL